MNPFVPLGVSRRVRLLIFGLEYADNLAVWVSREVAARAALRNHARVYLEMNGPTHALDNRLKLSPGHRARLGLRHILDGNGPNTFRRLKYGVMDLVALLVAELMLAPAKLEAGRDLIRPALQAGVDGLEIDAAVAAHTLCEPGPRGRLGCVHS